MRYYILLGTIAAVVTAWSGVWFYQADQLRTQIQYTAGQSTQAREWGYRDLEISGFPFRMLVELVDPRAAWRSPRVEAVWQSDRVEAVWQIWKPRHVLFDLTGRHRFKANFDGKRRQLTLDSNEAMASLESDAEERPERFSLDIKDILLRYDGSDGAAALRGERLQFHARITPAAPDSLDLALRADDLDMFEDGLPARMAGLPRTAKLVDLQLTVTGLPRDGPAAGFGEDALARWRDGGGTLEIKILHALWGGMEISASGSLALDGEMRPIGALTARIKGYDELLNLAVAAGAMDKDSLAASRMVLRLLAAAAGGVLSVPVRLQDGRLFLGPAAVARLAPVTGLLAVD